MRLMLHQLNDRQFFAALLIAPLLWLLGYLFYAPTTDWAWPLQQPRELLFLVLLYPVAEELLFRGLLQGELLRRSGGQSRWLGLTRANLITSAVFTALHFLAHPPLAAIAVLLPSLVFGHFRDRHGNLVAPMLLHVYYNLGYFWIFSS